MIFASLADLPATCVCNLCAELKPTAEMIVMRRRKSADIYLRPRCKACHNKQEQGHRRQYKTAYLRRWRRANRELNDSYWRAKQREKRAALNLYAYSRFMCYHDAILIQGRLRRGAGMRVTLDEVRQLAKQFGCCYPTRYGLTPSGLRECERIRSRLRLSGQHLKAVEIRMMVYADNKRFFIKPRLQRQPYQHAAQRLRSWHDRRRANAA